MRTLAGGSRSVRRIVSGGQTGVDRAVLDIALNLGYESGGFVPKGRLAEDGRIPETYPNLVETESAEPSERTRLNVLNSDATLLISRGPLAGGSLLTETFAEENGKSFMRIDLAKSTDANHVRTWLTDNEIEVLNVAGPPESEDPGIYEAALGFLRKVLQ